MKCLVCARNDLVEISLQLRGSIVTMHSCPVCNSRWWDHEGERVALGDVLTMAVPA